MPIITDNILELPDGRRLGYASYGPADGWPILFFHGTPGSRHSAYLAGLLAEARGARTIALDRPGYGLSDPHHGREIHDWPDDVAIAAELLGLERFSIFGYSGGGPFALATAAAHPERVASLTIVSGMGPLHTPESEARLSRRDRLVRFGMRRVPSAVRLTTWRKTREIQRDARGYLVERTRLAPEADRLQMETPAIQAVMLQDLRAALAQGGRAMARELVLLASPWRFDLEEIAAPVHVWHGREDSVVPIWLAESLMAAMPRAKAHFIDEAGHLLLLDKMPEILDELLAARDGERYVRPARVVDPDAALLEPAAAGG